MSSKKFEEMMNKIKAEAVNALQEVAEPERIRDLPQGLYTLQFEASGKVAVCVLLGHPGQANRCFVVVDTSSPLWVRYIPDTVTIKEVVFEVRSPRWR